MIHLVALAWADPLEVWSVAAETRSAVGLQARVPVRLRVEAAFLVRRSTPYDDGRERGLLFVAFGRSPDPFEAQLRRMVGLEDGVVDALFRFSRPTSGGTYACPPLGADGRLRL